METDVIGQGIVTPEEPKNEQSSDKEFNFRRLEAERNKEREERDVERQYRIQAEERSKYLEKDLDNLKIMLAPKEVDVWDSVEDLSDIDKPKLKSLLSQHASQVEKKIEASFEKKLIERERTNKQKNCETILRETYKDYDSFMNKDVVIKQEIKNPLLMQLISKIEDPYQRREIAYAVLKHSDQSSSKSELEEVSEKIEKNQKNPFFSQPSNSASLGGTQIYGGRSKAQKTLDYENLQRIQKGQPTRG